jgi:hypothetical protein
MSSGSGQVGGSIVTNVEDFASMSMKDQLIQIPALLVDPRLHAWLIASARPCNFARQRDPINPVARLQAAAAFAADARDVIDTYGRGTGLLSFEREVATLLGKPEGLFFTTGTCANQAAVRAAVEFARSVQTCRLFFPELTQSSLPL